MSLKTVLSQQAYLLFYIKDHDTPKEVCLLRHEYLHCDILYLETSLKVICLVLTFYML